MAEEERILEVTPDFDGKRIDQCLAASFSDCSRSFLQKLLKDGKVSINGKTQKASSKVAAGDAVLVLLPEPEELNVKISWCGMRLLILSCSHSRSRMESWCMRQ